jgi:hypothetical protein
MKGTTPVFSGRVFPLRMRLMFQDLWAGVRRSVASDNLVLWLRFSNHKP